MKTRILGWGGLFCIIIGMIIFLTQTHIGASILWVVKNPLQIFLISFGILAVGITLIIHQIYQSFYLEKLKQKQQNKMNVYLHDNVLQTLALIQNISDNPKAVRKIARKTEQEIREFLSGKVTDFENSLGKQIEMVLRTIEDERDVEIEYVQVGDISPKRMPVELRDAIIGSTIQAIINSIQHAKPPFNVMFNAKNDLVISIRDHGDGFNINEINSNRYGVKYSIIGRIQDLGGEVNIKSEAGFGTEIVIKFKVKHD